MIHTDVSDKLFNISEGNVLLIVWFFLTCLTSHHVDTDVFQPLDSALFHLTRKLQWKWQQPRETHLPLQSAAVTSRVYFHPACQHLHHFWLRGGMPTDIIFSSERHQTTLIKRSVFRCVRRNRRDGGKLVMQRDESEKERKGVQEVSRSPR